MIKKTLIASIVLLSCSNTYAVENPLRSTIELSNYSGEFIDDAQKIELRYQADKGGYAYANYMQEKSSDLTIEFKGNSLEAGMGVIEAVDSDVIDAETYMGFGIYTSRFEITSTDIDETVSANYTGFTGHLGVNIHPYTDKVTINFHMEHNASGNNPINDYNGVIKSKRTRTSVGVEYDFDYGKVKVSRSNDDITMLSLTFRY